MNTKNNVEDFLLLYSQLSDKDKQFVLQRISLEREAITKVTKNLLKSTKERR